MSLLYRNQWTFFLYDKEFRHERVNAPCLKMFNHTSKNLTAFAEKNLRFAEAAIQGCSIKKMFLKSRKIHEKKPVPQSCEFCEFFKDTFFIEHLRWLLLSLENFLKTILLLCHLPL